MKKTLFFYLICIFVFLNVVDMLTTIFILPGESNPIYLLTKSFIGILILKIVIVGAIIWLFVNNKYHSKTLFYVFVCTIVYGSLALLVAQVINIYAILTPHVLVQAAQATTQEKTSSYNSFMLFVYLLPLLFSLLCFVIYDKSINYIQIIKAKKLDYNKFLFWKR
jgi:hypothetical protein